MKKLLIVSAASIVVLATLAIVGYAFAQSVTPPTPTPVQGTDTQRAPWMMGGGHRMMGGYRPEIAARAGIMGWRQGFRQGMMMGFARGFSQGAYGPLHDYIVSALAQKLGLTVDDLNAKITDGERPYQIAKSQGFSDEQVLNLLQRAHNDALQAAVADGVIPQEQADRMSQMMGNIGQEGCGMGQIGSMRNFREGQTGPLHAYKVAAFAQAVGLTAEQVEARLEAGETMWQIAESQGLTSEQLQAKMLEVVRSAINLALADSKITQAQADWMIQRVEAMGTAGFRHGRYGPGRWPGMSDADSAQP
jgi:uncharacterized protein YidB (DUF937 family)